VQVLRSIQDFRKPRGFQGVYALLSFEKISTDLRQVVYVKSVHKLVEQLSLHEDEQNRIDNERGRTYVCLSVRPQHSLQKSLRS
jgi:hypothetical protein